MNSVARLVLLPAAFVALMAYGYFTLNGPQGIRALIEKRQSLLALQQRQAKAVRQFKHMFGPG